MSKMEYAKWAYGATALYALFLLCRDGRVLLYFGGGEEKGFVVDNVIVTIRGVCRAG